MTQTAEQIRQEAAEIFAEFREAAPTHAHGFRSHDVERGVVCGIRHDGFGGEICNTLNGFGNQELVAYSITAMLHFVKRLADEATGAA